MEGRDSISFALPPHLRAILEADYPRFSDVEMVRRRAAIAGLLGESGLDHLRSGSPNGRRSPGAAAPRSRPPSPRWSAAAGNPTASE